jgi:hypothetical protein
MITSFVTCIAVMSCSSPKQKVEDVVDKTDTVNSVQKEKEEETDKLNKDWNKYKKESEEKIGNFEMSIAELKLKIKSLDKNAHDKYGEVIIGAEKKKNDLKKDVDEYKNNGKDSLELFKHDFDNKLDELEKSLKDITAGIKK